MSPEHLLKFCPECNTSTLTDGAIQHFAGCSQIQVKEGHKPINPVSHSHLGDKVNHPAHYTAGGIECIDAIKSALSPDEFKGFLKGQVFKYIWREAHKGHEEDLQKAEWYLTRLLDLSTR